MEQLPAAEIPRITLKTTHRSGHPWIYQRMVERPKKKLPPGSVVDIFDKAGEWVGRGFYNGASKISVRLLTRDQNETIDRQFFERRLRAAVQLRRGLLRLDTVTDAYRLIHAEGDNLSGLIADKFSDAIVLEFYSTGMYQLKDTITAVLGAEFPGVRFVPFADPDVEQQEGFSVARGQPLKPVTITEHGVNFLVDPGGKHKTGFFSDQRDNRELFSQFSAGKRVLDLCCNTGGFAVYAGKKGAREVLGIDLDEDALELAERNSKLNRARVKYIQVDIFKWMREAIDRKEQYETVVLDPSKQAHDRDEVITALKRYTDMNRLALQVVAPGGTFLSCSCTGLVSEADFIESIRRAAWQAGRTLQIFKISGAGADHPFLTSALEGRYLKAVWARVF